jgi:hypothetical protein
VPSSSLSEPDDEDESLPEDDEYTGLLLGLGCNCKGSSRVSRAKGLSGVGGEGEVETTRLFLFGERGLEEDFRFDLCLSLLDTYCSNVRIRPFKSLFDLSNESRDFPDFSSIDCSLSTLTDRSVNVPEWATTVSSRIVSGGGGGAVDWLVVVFSNSLRRLHNLSILLSSLTVDSST